VPARFDPDSVRQRVLEVLARTFGLDPDAVALDAPVTGLRDSLGIVELILALEEEFEFGISDDEMDQLTSRTWTLRELIEFIARRITGGR
jgi:acyl carrier protein